MRLTFRRAYLRANSISHPPRREEAVAAFRRGDASILSKWLAWAAYKKIESETPKLGSWGWLHRFRIRSAAWRILTKGPVYAELEDHDA